MTKIFKNPEIHDPRTAMEALDEGLAAPENIEEVETDQEAASPTDEAEEGDMPLGHEQIDSDMDEAQIRKVRRNMYFFHAIVGPLLLPVALLLRAGRWSMRTLWAHHNGHEFGGF